MKEQQQPIEKATAVLKASRGPQPLFTRLSAFREAIKLLDGVKVEKQQLRRMRLEINLP